MTLILAAGFAAAPASAAEVLSDAPSDLSVTIYRAPGRGSGSLALERLDGFALVSESRTVRLPAGESRLRFEGVADGIEAASAIVTGLPVGIIEKNRDARLLSPSALIAAAAGKRVVLLRTHSKTGKTERLPGTVRSDADGVVFETDQGIEALRCSGLPESFSFSPPSGLSATPTLSILVRVPRPTSTRVTLSYLARGFDWAADYTATLSVDGEQMDLGAWVTLANANGVGFPSAHTQVVAGRLNRESNEVEPIDAGGPILARCWPRGSTSDAPEFIQIDRASPLGAENLRNRSVINAFAMAAAPLAKDMSAQRVEQEQLGDLKLYRVPERTTVASRQSKQIRLLDRWDIPIRRIYGAFLIAGEDFGPAPASVWLRTRNDTADHLGLPLPSGRVAVFSTSRGETLLVREAEIRDLAVDEEVEIDMGASSDVQIKQVTEKVSIDPSRTRELPVVPGLPSVRAVKESYISRVEVSNARAAKIEFELRLQLPESARITRADRPLEFKNGRPIFLLTIPAHETATVRYQATFTAD